MSELPDGWELVPLGAIALWGSGGTPNRANPGYFGDGIPWVTISDLKDGLVERTNESITSAGLENSTAKLVPMGTVLVALYGSIGKLGVASRAVATNQAIAYALPDVDAYDSGYLFYYLQSKRQDLTALGAGVTQQNIYLKDLKNFNIPLAPRREQSHIVAKLEALLCALDAGIAELRGAHVKLEQCRQSMLNAALAGRLTAEWREQWKNALGGKTAAGESVLPADLDASFLLEKLCQERRARWERKQLAKFVQQGKNPSKNWHKKYAEPAQPETAGLPKLPDGWVWASLDMLGDIVSGVNKGLKYSRDATVREVPYLRVANVQRGYFDLLEVKTMRVTERCIAELVLQDGDVLFNESGDRDKLGRGWVWRNQVAGCIHQNHVFRMRPFSSELQSELISHHGNAFGKFWFRKAGKQTTNIASINMTILRAFPVPVASVLEQMEILAKIRMQLESLVNQERTIDTVLKQSTEQRQNILRAAFSGQLVPQDPDDEPASVLLKRIRAKRAAQSEGKKLRGSNAMLHARAHLAARGT